ncbi:heterokaryon incompatibility protein-domain-containing protein [Apiospora sp. TS-2023a]
MEGLADDEFRLLILLPGDFNEPLRCDLSTSNLTNHPPYEALSYVWGSNADTVEIEVASKRLAITRSVEAMLYRLRQPFNPRTLWIDQLCIDQSNQLEKTSQVQKMRLIYSRCEHVLVWLGHIADEIRREDAENALALIEYMAAFSSGNGSPVRPRPECMESDGLFVDAMKALSTVSVTQGPWWHRVWTVQEGILPSSLLFIWGPLSVSWATVSSASIMWVRGGSMSSWQMSVAQAVGDMRHLMARVIWMNTSGEGHDKPIDRSIKWRDRAATDSRDNVFALTGLYTEKELPRSSKCDYSLGVNQVFIEFTLDLIYGGNRGKEVNLLPLALDPWQQDAVEISGLPHWAMDMRSIPKQNAGLWRTYWFYRHWESNKGLPQTGRPEYTGQSLQMSGVLVDTVDFVGTGLVYLANNPKEVDVGWPLGIRETIASWWNLLCNDKNQHLPASLPRLSPTNCSEYELFCRLVLGDTLEGRSHWPAKWATNQDRQELSDYLRTGNDNGIMRNHARHQLRNRRFFVTKKGLLGLGHLETSPGDEVWVFNHGRVPFTLRRSGTPGSAANENGEDYEFRGHCYVQGIMMGLGRALADLEQRRVCLH